MSTSVEDTLLLQTYDAVGDPAGWDALLGRWADALEADSGLLFTPGDQFSHQPMHGHRYDFETAQTYGEYYHLHDVWTHNGRDRGLFESGHVGCGEMLAPQRRLRQSLFYNDFLRRMGQEWLLCTVLFNQGNAASVPETVLSFYRGPQRRAFGRGAMATLQRAVPHLQRSLKLHHELLRARADRSLFESGLDQIGIGMLLLGADGRVSFANRRAETLLQPAAPPQPPLLPALQQLDRLARQGRYTGQRVTTAQGPVYAMATPNNRLAASNTPVRGHGAVIWLIDAQRQGGGAVALAASLFGLTRAEQKVLSLLMEDHTPKEIAHTLEVGVPTVRSQLSSLLQKTGVRRQQELLRLMAAFPQG